ncbi:hypothetical protein AB0L34_33565, partial [Micromonospora sp. NPDC052213]|uniref:hypothetical protein n=1 Tax=Micromonospora sp. NPDC052213 TaxID=3155812 RepID=UPI003438C9BB
MENWLVVDQRTDPTPGSPEQVRALADRLRQQADQSRKAGQRLRGVAVDRARLRLWGDYADVLDVMLAELPDDAATLTTAYDACAAALSGYAQELDQVQTASRLALRQGTQAHERYQALLQRFCQVVPVSFQGGGLWRGLDAASAAHLSQGLREPERQWAVALGREAGMCEFERQTACRAVAEAAHRHQDAANRCAQAVLAAAPRLSANRSRRTTPTRQTQPKGAKIVSAHLEDADVFRTAKAAGTTPRGPAVLVLRNRPDFDKR